MGSATSTKDNAWSNGLLIRSRCVPKQTNSKKVIMEVSAERGGRDDFSVYHHKPYSQVQIVSEPPRPGRTSLRYRIQNDQ